MNPIPQFLENFNMYGNGNRLAGVSADVTLPKFENISETVSGAGILGEFETPIPGAFKSQTLDVGFRVIDKAMFELASSNMVPLTFRGSQMITDYSKADCTVKQPVRIETRGGIKVIELGKATAGKSTDSKITQEILFIAVYIDNKEELYLDKLNYIYRVHGVDLTADTRANI